ncbi:MAG: hypothetical protein M3Y71_14895 [Actinomycetota bacterium]|nr:hypothetical protein [Actinomycetota bacterium]
MCFSAEADLIGSVIIGAIGADVLLHVRQRRDHLALAALPVMFAAHQLVETFVWWGLEGTVPSELGVVATWVYLLFAFGILPVYVPLAIRALEPRGPRRSVMTGFAVLGAVVATALLATMLRGPVTADLAGHHIAYRIDLPFADVVVGAYVVATCASALASGYHQIAIFGAVNLGAVAVIAVLTVDGFASVWCGWAAVTSAAIAVHVRRGRPHRSVVQALA